MEDLDFVLVNMVEENREGFYHIELYGVRESRQILAMFGYLSQKNFEHMVINLKNFPVIIGDTHNANKTYGCNVTTLKEKNVCSETRARPNRIHGRTGNFVGKNWKADSCS